MIPNARSSLARFAALLCALAAAPASAQQAAGDTAELDAIFDGTTLQGWDGDPAFWRVEHGAIVGETRADRPLTANTFLVWHGGTTRDFVVTLEYRMDTRNPAGNSGVQFRSSLLPEVGRWVMKGYQADIDAADAYTGQIYEERGRGFLARPGQVARVAPDGQVHALGSVGTPAMVKAFIKKGDWNDVRVVARGNVILELVNGHVTSLLVDDDERRARDGLLGLQLHAGPPMKIEFRNIRLRDLDAGTTLARTDWLTDGGNPQRTAWQGAETLLSTRSAKDIRLLWKIMLDNVPREMHSLLPALVVGRVDTREGPKEIVIVTGVSDNLYAIDAGRGVQLWKKRFDHAGVGDTTPHSGLM